MKKLTLRHITTAAAVGAVYAVLSIFGSVFITFGTVQLPAFEALCVLALLFHRRRWGLFVGAAC